MMNWRQAVLLSIGLLSSAARVYAAGIATVSPSNSPTADQIQFFETRIRPVLIENCYKCHSAQSQKLKGGLHVDRREGLLQGGDSGPAIVPGDVEKSKLIEAIRYNVPDDAMPPKQKLPAQAIKDLEQWVAMGAPWPAEADKGVVVAKKGPDYAKLRQEHWAYQPIGAANPPAVAAKAWPKNDIDRYVLASLEAKGLKPVADADRQTLIRRLSFDLIGLPPTPAEIDAFVNDAAPDATEKLVDRLLASPRFGERWGRHWLDVARYGESLTLRGFVLKDTWKYRDYVISQFNDDRPFNQFLKEQIAGDLMPAGTPEQRKRQLTGTTFLAMGNHNLEEQDKKQLRMDVVDEQLDTIGKAMLGQTIGCARCHDHKFDPIPTRDYYAMAGILRSTKTLEHSNVSKWMEVPVPESADRESELTKHDSMVAALQSKIAAAKSALGIAAKGKLTSSTPISPADLPGIVIDDSQAKKVGNWKVSTSVKNFIGEGYCTDENQEKGEKTITFQPDIPVAGKYEVRLAYTTGTNRCTKVPVTVFSADGEKIVEVNERLDPPIDDHFISLGQFSFEKNGAGFVLLSNEGTNGHVIADAVQFIPVDQLAAGDATAGAAPAATIAPTTGPSTRPTEVFTAQQVKQMEAELKKLQTDGPKRQTVMSVVEEKQIEDSPIHVRGNVHNLGPVVPRGFLSCVSVQAAAKVQPSQSGRLELADWLIARDNPLPPRVMANRVWGWLMGDGIVRTADNFGTTGEAPSNRKLLDYLAERFIRENWSVKKLIREIVLSRTYQLAFADDSKAAAVDPENRLNWRANRKRQDADALRDAILAISGQLDFTVGGPTYKTGLSSDYNFKHVDTRRSVYTAAFRNAIDESLEVFDAADPSLVTGRRNASTVAPQALFMLNHPFIAEQSIQSADRLMKEGPTDAGKRAELAYELTLGRKPTARESALVLKYVNAAPTTEKNVERDAWADVFHGLFASIDFRYLR